jgi:hypothetical protein
MASCQEVGVDGDHDAVEIYVVALRDTEPFAYYAELARIRLTGRAPLQRFS